MASDKQLLIRWFYRAELDDGELDFQEVLARAVKEALGKKDLDVDGFVTANLTRYWNCLLAEAEENKKRGVTQLVQGATTTGIRRCTWFPPIAGCSPSEALRYRRLRLRPGFLRAIDSLNDREYEAAGVILARVAGADKFLLTPHGNEGGIDFFARMPQGGRTHIFSGSWSPIRIVGQSKQYDSKVSVDLVRDFITTLDCVRYQAKQVKDLIPAWFKDVRGPIIGWIISHNGFQSGAETLANDHGIVLSTSIDMAEALSHSDLHAPFLHLPDKQYEFVRQVRACL
ncbi:MAG: hypothetical protein ACM31P_09615 [Actinomycetota bacterium]